jgi:hypothetical protein
MSELVANCPRCKAKEMTFDLICEIPTHMEYSWQRWFEAFSICRQCNRSTVFVLAQRETSDDSLLRKTRLSELQRAVNQVMFVKGHITLKDQASEKPPEYLPENINAVFKEGAACMAIGCHNAGATMFRLCIDLATKSMLPEGEVEGLNNKVRRNLGLRLPWLFKNNILPNALEELSSCIKDDGNDGAHEGTLNEQDAEDILDFTYVLLERLYTEPKRLELAKERRQARRTEA